MIAIVLILVFAAGLALGAWLQAGVPHAIRRVRTRG